MKVLTIDVASREQINERFARALDGRPQGDWLTFPSLEQLHKLLNPRRIRLLEAIQKWGPIGVRELARRLELDPGNVARDLKPLREWGIVKETRRGLKVPYDQIRLEVVIGEAA